MDQTMLARRVPVRLSDDALTVRGLPVIVPRKWQAV
jgi:hypothetical protein